MEKTAVEWLTNELKSLGIYSSTLKEKCEQAKEVEKQNIIDAYNEGIWERKQNEGEQYYNQTFSN